MVGLYSGVEAAFADDCVVHHWKRDKLVALSNPPHIAAQSRTVNLCEKE